MAKFKKLSTQELEEMMTPQPKPSPRSLERQRALQEMKEFLSQIQPGEGGEIVLEEGDNRLTIKNRLKKAAEELGVELKFIRKRKRIVFQVLEKQEGEAQE